MIQKPYNISVRGITIDANEENVISWSTSGGIQTSYKLEFLSNADNTLVFDTGVIQSYQLTYKLPTGTLTNGNEYKIRITVYDIDGKSATSDAEVFRTSSRPVVVVDTIGTINSFSYNFSATYSQAEEVSMRNYIFILYNSERNIIDQSNIKTISPVEHLFSNLETERNYFIEVQVTSAEGLVGTSGLVPFDVFYVRPKMNVSMSYKEIENGGIELSWYVTQIIGETNDAVFINDEKIDTTENRPVWFDEGFDINGNFSLKLWIEQPYVCNVVDQVNLISLHGINGTIYLQYWDDRKFHLWKEVNGIKSHWFSGIVEGEQYFVSIQQIEKDMNIYSEVIS